MKKFRFDFFDFKRGLKAGYRDQIPFAPARAITTTAQDVQVDIQAKLGSIFTLRNTHLLRGIRIQAATKTSLFSKVGTIDPKLVDHVLSGTRSESGERSVPAKAIRPIFSEKVSKGHCPSSLIAKGGQNKPFFMHNRKGRGILVSHKRGKSGDIKVLYGFPK